MVTTLQNSQRIRRFIYCVDQTVFSVDSTGPVSRKVKFQGFGFADALEWCAHGIFNQGIETFECSLVCFLPVEIVLPRLRRPR